MLKFSFEFVPSQGITWPEISISLGQQTVSNLIIADRNIFDITFDSDPGNVLKIFYHKTESETIVEHGEIVKDQSLKLNRIWVDDVLMESWFITEGCYYPNYFAGIRERFPDWPSQLPSQTIWHFPGLYEINFAAPFWPWYHKQRKKFSEVQHSEKDNERWENWSGSSDSHSDLVKEIYRLLNV